MRLIGAQHPDAGLVPAQGAHVVDLEDQELVLGGAADAEADTWRRENRGNHQKKLQKMNFSEEIDSKWAAFAEDSGGYL